MEIAVLAHDRKKELMVQFCIAYKGILAKHNLIATGHTGSLIVEATGLSVKNAMSGSDGGGEQISARIAYGEIDLVLFFRDPMENDFRESDMSILRLCDLHSIPVATNIATAEVLIHGLEQGLMDWRNLIK